jgi:hypothetical protein
MLLLELCTRLYVSEFICLGNMSNMKPNLAERTCCPKHTQRMPVLRRIPPQLRAT